MHKVIAYQLRHVDVVRARVDVLALKYARKFRGVDRAVTERLAAVGVDTAELQPGIGEYVLEASEAAIRAPEVLLVGVPELKEFNYEEIRRFSAQVLTILAREAPEVRTVAMTLHGPGYGLDIVESAQQQFLGVRDALEGGSYPPGLERVVIVELNRGRVESVATAIEEMVGADAPPPDWSASGLEWPIFPVPPPKRTRAKSARAIRSAVNQVAGEPEKKQRVFVAMPYDRRMRDIWKFGIRGPVRAAGLLCERMDEEYFTGDILKRIWDNIESADLIIADLTGGSPSVFLEVGYAWAKERPTLLICKKPETGEARLPFDVTGHRCLFYEDAVDLEEQLARFIAGLRLGS